MKLLTKCAAHTSSSPSPHWSSASRGLLTIFNSWMAPCEHTTHLACWKLLASQVLFNAFLALSDLAQPCCLGTFHGVHKACILSVTNPDLLETLGVLTNISETRHVCMLLIVGRICQILLKITKLPKTIFISTRDYII